MFNDFYGIYKDARNASWNFLLLHQINRLPVDLKSITDKLRINVRVDNAKMLNNNQRGMTLLDNDIIYILVRPNGTANEN